MKKNFITKEELIKKNIELNGDVYSLEKRVRELETLNNEKTQELRQALTRQAYAEGKTDGIVTMLNGIKQCDFKEDNVIESKNGEKMLIKSFEINGYYRGL